MATRKKRLIGLTVVVAIAAAGGYATYDFWKRQQSAPTDIVLYGNVDIREADLAFNVAGRIESMLVEEGDLVENGQLIATLEADIYRAEVEAAEARVGAQRAVLDRLLAGSRPQEIKEARANVQAIEANLEDARANLRRTEKLAKDNFATLQKLDEDRAHVNISEAQLKAAQQVLSLAIQGPRDEEIAEARARLRADQAELALTQRRLDYTTLLAKSRGVVKTRVLEPGGVVLSHEPVYTIALSDPVWVRTYVSEPDLGRIHPGMAVEVSTDTFPDEAYEGWIGFISPVAEFTPKTVETREVRTSLVYRLRVYVKNPDNGLRQGMPATVRLKPAPDDGKAGQSAFQ
jgi:multidrug resistance efflux pump